MNLRSRIHNALQTKAESLLPEAFGSVWSEGDGLVVYLSDVTFGPAIGHDGHWALKANFTGEVQAEFRADDIDDLPVEALVSDLISGPMIFAADEAVAVGGLSEQARVRLMSLTHELRDGWIVGLLTFDLEGRLVERLDDIETPDDVFVNDCPPSRQDPGPVEDYVQMTELAP